MDEIDVDLERLLFFNIINSCIYIVKIFELFRINIIRIIIMS